METKELEKEFLTMIEAQKRTIYKVCYIYANDQDDLNDLYQETVLNLWKSFPRYRGDSKLATWVYRIAMNTCITFLRRSNARPQTVPMTANVASMAAEDNETAGQLRELYRLINQLGKLERALILLWLEERSYEEIADILGITKTNVAVKLTYDGIMGQNIYNFVVNMLIICVVFPYVYLNTPIQTTSFAIVEGVMVIGLIPLVWKLSLLSKFDLGGKSSSELSRLVLTYKKICHQEKVWMIGAVCLALIAFYILELGFNTKAGYEYSTRLLLPLGLSLLTFGLGLVGR